MILSDLNFIPCNDMHPDNISLVRQHKILIEQGKWSDAVKLLDDIDYNHGFRASLFNGIDSMLQQIQLYLLNKHVDGTDEIYSVSQPTEDQMKRKTYWIMPYGRMEEK